MLKLTNLHTRYGSIHALKGINLHVESGEIVTLIGSNGAGKTTTLGSITGLIPPCDGEISFLGQNISKAAPYQIVKAGISMSPEGREVFPALSVAQNLRLGAYVSKDSKKSEDMKRYLYDLFPRLKEREKQAAGTLSGGEQQMLAIARALMNSPKLLLLDEPSLGLAPNLVKQIFELIKKINEDGMTILLVEQNANMALKIAHRAYVLETGEIALEGAAAELEHSPEVRRAYLGLA